MRNYKALVRSGRSLHLEQRKSSDDLADGLWLRVLRAGICGTDLQILRGIRSDLAQVLGHEGVGEVRRSEMRFEATESKSASYAIFNPVDRSNQDKILGHSYDGVFAEAVHLAPDSIVYADPRLPADLAPLVEPLATALYGWRLLSIRGDPVDVGIWGGGSAAVLTALVTTINGAQAHIFHRRPERLIWLSRIEGLAAVELHCTGVTSPAASSLYPRLDAGVLCVPRDGAMLALEQALGLVRADGCIDLFGGFAPGDSSALLPGVDLGFIRRQNVCGEVKLAGLPISRGARGRVWLTGHRGSSAVQLAASQRMLLAHLSAFGSVISNVVSLEKAADLILSMLYKSENREFLKVIIDLTMTEPNRDLDLILTLAQLKT